MEQKNFYLLLEINRSASAKEIKSAYRELAKKYHPDKNQGNNKSSEYFKEIQLAYSVLSNPDKRKAYDLKSGIFNTFHATTDFRKSGASPYNFAKAATEAQRDAASPSTTNSNSTIKQRVDFFPLLISVIAAILLLLFIVLFKM